MDVLIKHARYYWLLPMESYLTLHLFSGILQKIAALLSPTGQAICRIGRGQASLDSILRWHFAFAIQRVLMRD